MLQNTLTFVDTEHPSTGYPCSYKAPSHCHCIPLQLQNNFYCHCLPLHLQNTLLLSLFTFIDTEHPSTITITYCQRNECPLQQLCYRTVLHKSLLSFTTVVKQISIYVHLYIISYSIILVLVLCCLLAAYLCLSINLFLSIFIHLCLSHFNFFFSLT